jgi:uncharacterized protein YbjT (DUF2867 family)
MGKTAIVAGATGLIGEELVKCLLESPDFTSVIILIRKSTNLKHEKLTELVIDYEKLDAVGEYFAKANVFCALGTTIKVAKTKEAFRKVDYEYPLQLAKLVQKYGAEQFHVVTAMGANPNSSIFYSQVKGQLEIALEQLKLPSLHIYHPSLLLGNRKEFRLGERAGAVIMRVLSVALIGKLRKYRAIHVKTIAKSMIYASLMQQSGTQIYEYNEITKFASKI